MKTENKPYPHFCANCARQIGVWRKSIKERRTTMKSKAQIELEEIIQEEWQAFYRGERTVSEMNAFNVWVEHQEEELDRNWELEYEE